MTFLTYTRNCVLAAIAISFLIFISSLSLSAQSLQPGMEDFTPPNPDAAALVKFTESPVSYSSGSIQMNIPITQAKGISAATAVSLSYHGSGIRTRQEATKVGLGWSLQAGGVVTRTVLGLPDEHPNGYQNKYSLFNV